MPLTPKDIQCLIQYRDKGAIKGLALTNMISDILENPIIYTVDRNSINDFVIRGKEITEITDDIHLGMPFNTMVLEINQFFRYKLTYFDILSEINVLRGGQSLKNLMKKMHQKQNSVYLEKIYLQSAYTKPWLEQIAQERLALYFHMYESGVITSIYSFLSSFIKETDEISVSILDFSIMELYGWADNKIGQVVETIDDRAWEQFALAKENKEDMDRIVSFYMIKEFCSQIGNILRHKDSLATPLKNMCIHKAITSSFGGIGNTYILKAIKKCGLPTEKAIVHFCFGKALRTITGEVIESYSGEDSYFKKMINLNGTINSKKVIVQYRINNRKEFHVAYMSNDIFLNKCYKINAIGTSDNTGVKNMMIEILDMLNGFGFAWENRCVITTEKTTTKRVRVSKKSKRKAYIKETQRVLSYNTDVGEIEIEKTKIINTDETPKGKGTGSTKCPHTRREHFAYCWIKESNSQEDDVWYDVKESKNGQCMLVKVRRKRRSANIHCGGSINGEIRS